VVKDRAIASAKKFPEHYLDLIDIALSDKQRARSVVKKDSDESHEAHELLQDMEINRD
jgi:hypothetical protein